VHPAGQVTVYLPCRVPAACCMTTVSVQGPSPRRHLSTAGTVGLGPALNRSDSASPSLVLPYGTLTSSRVDLQLAMNTCPSRS